MRIAFRTDSSLQIGTGHLMRCLTLADELARRGHDVLFICRELAGNVNALVCEWGHRLELLPAPPASGVVTAQENALAHAAWLGVSQDTDTEQTVAALDRAGADKLDWLVVDHYALDARWEAHLRSRCARLMVIDDLADRPHVCDLLLDQNLYPDMEARYQGLVPDTCHALLGPHFALLRPEFARARQDLRTRTREVRRVLVFFGGVDAGNVTMKALEALSLVADPRIHVDVVVGRSNPHQTQLHRYCEGHPEFCLHVQTERIAELMAAADLAIGGSGVAAWERCAVGLPALVLVVAANQVENAREVDRRNACVNLGEVQHVSPQVLADAVQAVMNDKHLAAMSEAATRLVDGRGTPRVAAHIEAMNPVLPDIHERICLRMAVSSDSEALFRWRNDERTRSFSFHTGLVEWSEHVDWMERTLADPHRYLLIGEIGATPVGVLRYDVSRDIVEVSVYKVPGSTGHGLGTEILKAGISWAKTNLTDVKKIRARVIPSNTASLRAFEKAGYREVFRVFEVELDPELPEE